MTPRGRRILLAVAWLTGIGLGVDFKKIDWGRSWKVDEYGYWKGTWTRKPDTVIFSARFVSADGREERDVIEIVSYEKGKIVLKRSGNGGTYTGTLSRDGRQIRGTASWYPPGRTWTAVIFGQQIRQAEDRALEGKKPPY